ncbi:hypothetical protein FOZ63_033193 [Perkinsus olseni]|uniref:Uncharacterized protein n=1 Tax=Perkinsus olseni TaxID=32597 RepID=A0A7J6SJK4_PEROL|nr:hypothetical protein FOZ63_033193 [Perkinsus olseni]
MFVQYHHEAVAKTSAEMIDPGELVNRYGKRELGDVLGSRRDEVSAASGDNLVALRWSVACCVVDSDDDAGHELIHEHYLLEEMLISLIQCIVKTVGGGKCAIVIAAVKFIRQLASGVAKERAERCVHGLPDRFKDFLFSPREGDEDDSCWRRLTLRDLFQLTHNIRCNVLGTEGGKWEDDFAAAFFEFTNSEAEAFLNTDARREAQSTKSLDNMPITSWDRADAVEKALMEYRTALVEDGNWQHPQQEPAIEEGERALIPDGIHRQKTPSMYQPSKSKQEKQEPVRQLVTSAIDEALESLHLSFLRYHRRDGEDLFIFAAHPR